MSRMLLSVHRFGFDPSYVSDLALWLRSDKGVTKNGSDLVSNWANQASTGSNYDFIQSTDGNKPTWVTNQLNGKPGIVFNGTSSRMDIQSAGRDLLKSVGGATMFIVWKSAITGTKQNAFFARDSQSGGFNGHLSIARAANCQDISQAERVNNVGTTTITADSYMGVVPQLNSVVADYTNTDLYLYRNSNLVASNTSFETGGSTTNADAIGITLGCYPQNGNEWLNGAIYEILIYRKALNSTQRGQVETYLKTKYALTPQQLIVFDGDSQTSGVAVSVAQTWSAQMIAAVGGNYYWQNVGVQGAQIWEQKDRANAGGGIFVRSYHSDEQKPWLCFMGGGNDMMAGSTIVTTYGRLKTYFTEANATTKFSRLLASTLIPAVNAATTDALRPYNDTYIIPGAVGPSGDLYATGVRYLARPDTLTHFDTNTAMDDPLYYQGDKLHPTVLGNTTLFPAWRTALGI